MSDLRYWLALNFLPDIGPVLARKLLSSFGSPENIFQMPLEEVRRVEDIGESRARSITGFKEWDRVEKEIEGIARNKAEILTINDRSYPAALRQIDDAPPLLYVKGNLAETDRYAVSVVGSRASTGYGTRVAEEMGYGLASRGLAVVSGMARGIDTAAHRGALKANGRTIAVLGSGINVPYPHENRELMKRIAGSGAVISEFPLGTIPDRNNFPRRNRIISALSLGVVVIEASVDSGSLITVGYALEQGREVFAVPGNITSRSSKGTNGLIKKGAMLVESAEEVIEELGPQINGILREDRGDVKRSLPPLTDDEKVLYKCLTDEPKHIDSIIREANMLTGRALSILLSLELKGVVRQVEGKRFSIN